MKNGELSVSVFHEILPKQSRAYNSFRFHDMRRKLFNHFVS